MITPQTIDERTTLAELALILNAFGLMMTSRAGAAYEITVSDEAGVIGHADGATLAEAIRFAITDYIDTRHAYDRGEKITPAFDLLRKGREFDHGG